MDSCSRKERSARPGRSAVWYWNRIACDLRLPAILAAYTIEAAWAAREEEIDGSIAIGKAADLAVLDGNLFETDPGKLHDVRVLLTLLDGEPVYRDPSFAWH